MSIGFEKIKEKITAKEVSDLSKKRKKERKEVVECCKAFKNNIRMKDINRQKQDLTIFISIC
jgi:hypothetical protein